MWLKNLNSYPLCHHGRCARTMRRGRIRQKHREQKNDVGDTLDSVFIHLRLLSHDGRAVPTLLLQHMLLFIISFVEIHYINLGYSGNRKKF